MEGPIRQATRTITRLLPLALLLLVGGVAQPVEAGQFSVPITVKVTLTGENSGICRSTNQIGAFGAAVTIVCASGAPTKFSGDTSRLPWSSAQDGPFHYLTLRSATGELLASVESRTDRRVTNSWNVVKVNDREYLELMVSW